MIDMSNLPTPDQKLIDWFYKKLAEASKIPTKYFNVRNIKRKEKK